MRAFVKTHSEVLPLTGDALMTALADKYQADILRLSLKYERARKKETKMLYRQQVGEVKAKLAELTEDRSIKIDN